MKRSGFETTTEEVLQKADFRVCILGSVLFNFAIMFFCLYQCNTYAPYLCFNYNLSDICSTCDASFMQQLKL